MTSDEAREHFSAAAEMMLDPAQQEAFEHALAHDAQLRDEYETFRRIVHGAHKLSPSTTPDVLHSVQNKLHQRSGGRYYRDRFARLPSGWTLWIVTALIVGLVLAFVVLRWLPATDM